MDDRREDGQSSDDVSRTGKDGDSLGDTTELRDVASRTANSSGTVGTTTTSKSAREEQEEEAMAALMTDLALREDAESASASAIQDDVMKTLHQIEGETRHRRGGSRSTLVGAANAANAGVADSAEAKESESDVVVVMNVALKVEGVTKKEFHEMEPEARSRLMTRLIDTNVSANATTDNAGSAERSSENDESAEKKFGERQVGGTNFTERGVLRNRIFLES